MYSCYYIIYKLYHKLFGYFVFYNIIIYNNCQFGTSDKYFHLKSCFWCCVVLNLSEVINGPTGQARLVVGAKSLQSNKVFYYGITAWDRLFLSKESDDADYAWDFAYFKGLYNETFAFRLPKPVLLYFSTVLV